MHDNAPPQVSPEQISEPGQQVGQMGVPGRAAAALLAAMRGRSGAPPGRLACGDAAVQRRARGPAAGDVHAAARQGIVGTSGQLPFLDKIQRLFGKHDVTGVKSHTDANAAAGSRAMGAEAFAFGEHVAFAGAPTLHTTAHEAAHVIQQRGGVQLKGGLGEAGDVYERHADAVAARVVAGESAEDLLDQHAGGGGGPGIQCVIGTAGHNKPVHDEEFRRYLAIRTAEGDGTATYRLVSLETGGVQDGVTSDDATYDLVFPAKLDGEITAATEDELTVRYAPGHTVTLYLFEHALDLLRVGDHVWFTLDESGDIENAEAMEQVVPLINDDEGAVGQLDDGHVADISVEQQDGPTCWAATTASIAAYYGNTDWTQEALIGQLGALADTPESVTIALQSTGNLGQAQDQPLSFDQVQQEIDGGHPIIAGLRGNPGHVVLICGYRTTADQLLCIADPNRGGQHSWVNYRHFALGAVRYDLGLFSPAPHGFWGNSWTTRAAAAEEMEDESTDDLEDQITLALLDNAHLPEVAEFLVDGAIDGELLPGMLHHRDDDTADDILDDLVLGPEIMALINDEIMREEDGQDSSENS